MKNETDGTDTGIQATARDLLGAARSALESGDQHGAFQLLNRAKALKAPLEGVDQLRGRILFRAKQPLAAREVLLEELRYFPGNSEAKALLARIEAALPALLEPTLSGEEFRELYRAIRPYTMLGEKRLHNLYTMARKICERDLPGNFVECGVAAGGASALLAAVIARHSTSERRLFACDSFEGMPVPSELDKNRGVDAEESGWGTGTCAAPVESLREICATLGVTHLVEPVEGYFETTLPAHAERIGAIALLHLDSDWYESTRTVLDSLYDRIAGQGFVQLDDYHFWEGVGQAFHEFEQRRGLSHQIKEIDGTGVWFEKP